MNYMILNATVAIADSAVMDNALKEIAYSSRIRERDCVEYKNIVLPFTSIEGMDLAAIERDYADFMWACFEDMEGDFSAEMFAPLVPFLQKNDELLRFTTKFKLKEVITDEQLGIVYFDGSMSEAGCSGVAIMCLDEDAANGVYDAYSQKKRGYNATGTIVTQNPTNNVGELNGMCFAVDYTKTRDFKYWVIIGDSEYTLKSIREWRFNWQNNGWRNSQKKEIANADLIKHIAYEIDSSEKNISFMWVKGHSGNPMNEMCDLACKQMTGYV